MKAKWISKIKDTFGNGNVQKYEWLQKYDELFPKPHYIWLAQKILERYNHTDTEGVKYNKEIIPMKSNIEYVNKLTKFATKVIKLCDMKCDIYHMTRHWMKRRGDEYSRFPPRNEK